MKKNRSVFMATIAACAGVTGLVLFYARHLPFALGPGAGDFGAPLLGGYTLECTSAHQIYISWQGGLEKDLLGIPSKVLECVVHPPFILGKRQGLTRRSPDNPEDDYQVPDPNVFDYWILDTRPPGKVFGPLTLEEFAGKRSELGVPEGLSLREVYSYRK